jgi:TolA-binding protein
VARLQHAGERLDTFLRRHPASPRADEALYRSGEIALQRATLQYNTDLAAYLARGGRAEAAPVPIESYAEALDAYKRLLQDHPSSPRAHDAEHQVGFLLAEMGSVEASCEHLQRFLAAADSTDRRAGRAALRLGDNRLLLGDTPGALTAFRSAAQAPDPETRDLGLFKAGWCAYDLDQHAEARQNLYTLLRRAGPDSSQAGPRAAELAPEALELLALAFAADHDARGTAQQLDAWGRQDWDFALLRRMAQIYASRALYDEAIATDELLLERHALHPELPAVGEDLLHWIALRHGAAAAHERAARLAPLFAPRAIGPALRPLPGTGNPRRCGRVGNHVWSRRMRLAARADSLSLALAAPEAAAARMAERLRAAAVFEHQAAQADTTHAGGRLQARCDALRDDPELFPGAADEARTELYLGEARYALGDHEHAADAYAAAALIHRPTRRSCTRLQAPSLRPSTPPRWRDRRTFSIATRRAPAASRPSIRTTGAVWKPARASHRCRSRPSDGIRRIATIVASRP